MKTDRERLIEMLDMNKGFSLAMPASAFADYLISKGVAVPTWVSVEERLPEDNETVIAINSTGDMDVCFYEKEWEGVFQRYCGEIMIFDVTHWMPIPDPPIDLVPCFECKHSQPKPFGKYRECAKVVKGTVTPSDRCPYGERKDE